jgi:transposase-like protein
MRGPAEKPFDPVVSPLFLNAIHEELRQYDGERVGDPRPCPNCGDENRRKNGYQNAPKTFARLVTESGIETVGVDVQQYECTNCSRSYQGDLSEHFYEGCAYAKPIVDLCRFHALDHSPSECERVLRRRYGLQVNRDTVERYAERFPEPEDRHAIDIAGHTYSLDFLSHLFGEGDGDEPAFVIKRFRAIW